MAATIDGRPSSPETEESVAQSTVNGVKEEIPSKPGSRKLRILCLHGFRTSGKILSEQVALAKWGPLHDDIAELEFIDGPWPARGKSNVENKFAGPYLEWYQFNEDSSEVFGLEEATSRFSEHLSSHGPFDGLLGFSQGGALAASWIGLSEKGLRPNIPNVKDMFFIVVGGFKGKSKSFFPAYAEGIKAPSLHFIGDKDFVREFGEKLLPICKDPLVIRHPFGHLVPRLTESDGQIYRDFLLKRLQFKIES